MLDSSAHDYRPVVRLPDEYEVRDFTSGDDSPSKYEYDIGRYDELRPGMYSTDLFEGSRFLHVGIDIGAPVGTPCMLSPTEKSHTSDTIRPMAIMVMW